MKTQVVLIETDELKELINKSVSSAILQTPAPQAQETLLKRKDVANLFSVSLVTINDWMKTGKIPYHRINSRIFFKRSELMEALQNPKNIRRRIK